MLVRDIEIGLSPQSADRVRLRAEVVFDNRAFRPEVLWFDVPLRYKGELNQSGDPWAVLLLPVAMNLGEPLRLARPIDPVLWENLQEVMRVWCCWYPHLRPVPLEADVLDTDTLARGTRRAAFFSSGVDAWFTVLRHAADFEAPPSVRLQDLLTVWGLDIPLDRCDEFGKMKAVLERAAAAFGLVPIDIVTNLRQHEDTTWWSRADWGHLAHGCALAGIALALESRYAHVYIPSTHRYDDPIPWGSHPLTDPLLGTSRTRIVHDGAGFSRVEKTAGIATSDLALNSLQVCWETKAFSNCGACGKCYRTMTTLMLLGALQSCGTFNGKTVDLAELARVFLRDASGRALMLEVRALALTKGRRDVVRSIDRSLRRSARLARALQLTRTFADKRFIWRYQEPLERWLMAGSLTE